MEMRYFASTLWIARNTFESGECWSKFGGKKGKSARRSMSGETISDRLINNCFVNVKKKCYFWQFFTLNDNTQFMFDLHASPLFLYQPWRKLGLLACTVRAMRLLYFRSHLVLYGSFTPPPYLELKINLHCIWFGGKVKGNERHVTKCAVATQFKMCIY